MVMHESDGQIGEEELLKYPSISALRVMYIQSIGFELVIPIESEYAAAEVIQAYQSLPGFLYQVERD